METPKASEYGLEQKKAKQIQTMFQPMLDKMVGLEKEFNEVIKLPKTVENCAKAKELRLRLVKVRTGTAEIHKELKAFYLKGGRFVDGWKNAQLMAADGLEKPLKEFEEHFERLATAAKEKLQEERAAEVAKYDRHAITDKLGEMPPEIWENYLFGVEAAAKAREERDEKERKEKEEQDRKNDLHAQRHKLLVDDWLFVPLAMRNQHLGELTNEEWDKLTNDTQANKTKHEEEQKAKDEEIARLKKEQKEKDDAAAEETRKQNEALEKERKKREALEEENRKKEEQEAARIEEENRLAQLELQKGDKAKVNDLVFDLNALKTKYTFKSAKNKKLYAEVGDLLDKIVNHVKK